MSVVSVLKGPYGTGRDRCRTASGKGRDRRLTRSTGRGAAKAHSDEASRSRPHKLILGNGTDRCPVVCPAS
ncbi:hypothetical protein GCM10010433_33650 [Streptomyces pulveraceus]